MILTGDAIREAIRNGEIEINPFDESQMNPNSYNLRLDRDIKTYRLGYNGVLDCKKKNPTMDCIITKKHGMILYPGKLYLGTTVEFTKTNKYVPMLEGRSSLARLGISVHQTGGFGDIGFAGQWTLEITCVEPVRIYPDMQVCQIQFWVPVGKINKLYSGKYLGQAGPQASKLDEEM